MITQGHPADQRARAIGMLLLANVLWGLSFPVSKTLIFLTARLIPESGGGFIVAAISAPRFFLASIAMLAWHFWSTHSGVRRPPERTNPRSFVESKEFRQGIYMGLFTAIAMLLQSDGLRFTTASTSAFLTQFYAITIPLWIAVRRRKIPGLTVWGSCLLVLAGVAILGRLDWHDLRFGRGELETLLASFFFMGQILWLEDRAFAGNRASRVTLIMFATEGIAFGALGFATAPHLGALFLPWISPAWVGLTLLLAVFCTLGAFSLMVAWQPKITATEAGLIYCAEPIFGSLFALLLPALFSAWAKIDYPNETATFHLLVGGGLITFANILIQLRPPSLQRA